MIFTLVSLIFVENAAIIVREASFSPGTQSHADHASRGARALTAGRDPRIYTIMYTSDGRN